MVSISKLFKKAKPPQLRVAGLNEPTRQQENQGIHKFYIPKYLYKPPFGYPRFQNIPYLKYLAKTPYVEMCITTIIDSIAAVPWDIVAEEGFEDDPRVEGWIKEVKTFFENPNTNRESFEEVFVRKPVRDILEINSGVLVKVFNLREEMVEIVAVDGSTFTKNPNIHGMYAGRKDIIIQSRIVEPGHATGNIWTHISTGQVREDAAYFQYGWTAGPSPIPFGNREIIWMERNQRTDEFYPAGPTEILAKTLQMLLYMIESDLQYYNDNNIPKGVIGLEGAEDADIQAFKQQWNEKLRSKDEFGLWRRDFHNVPILNFIPKFERIEFSAQELQVIEKQNFYMKMVWASYGVTPTELGYTEDAKGMANQIVQSKVFRKKTIHPMLRGFENKYSEQIIHEEFGYPLRIKYLMFDIDDERAKWEHYETVTSAGLKTVNEIRAEEGLEPVSWGDDPPRNWQTPTNSFFGNGGNEDKPFNEREKEAQDTRQSNKVPDPKDPDDSANDKDKKADDEHPKKKKKKKPSTYSKDDVESKAGGVVGPLVLRENEVISEDKLINTINSVLDKQEDFIKDLIDNEFRPQPVAGIKSKPSKKEGIKSLNEVIAKIKGLLGLQVIKAFSDSAIQSEFFKGWNVAEKDINRNLRINEDALLFIQDYTFENIKGMNDALATSLRQELSRAFMDNESLAEVKTRVTKVFDASSVRAEAIARTEFNRANNYGKLMAYKEAEIEFGIKGKKVWITTGGKMGDGRTSELCKRLDGQEVDLDADFVDPAGTWRGQSSPSHPNCRSSWSFVPE